MKAAQTLLIIVAFLNVVRLVNTIVQAYMKIPNQRSLLWEAIDVACIAGYAAIAAIAMSNSNPESW